MNNKIAAKITSYDLYKTFAVLTMFIDHIGHFFFPDDLWWRAVGRMSGPVWIFLIGYARSRDLPPMLLIGACVLGLAHYFDGTWMPVNILFSFILVRMMIDKMAVEMYAGVIQFITFTAILLVLLLPSYLVFDYGTLCFMIGMCGFMMRNQERYPVITTPLKIVFFIVSLAAYIWASIYFFSLNPDVKFTLAQDIVVALGATAVFIALYRFKPVEYPALEARLPAPVKGFLNLCGHYTLEIYILHILAFMVAKEFLRFFL